MSDLHGALPCLVPVVDLVLIGGDICPVSNHHLNFQERWIKDNFYPWCREHTRNNAKVIFVGGNHDLLLHRNHYVLKDYITNPDDPMSNNKGIYYLEDRGITARGLSVWGTPWSLPFGWDWAFNATEEETERTLLLRAPDRVDILISHGPPYGCGDLTEEGEHVGSHALRSWILDKQPKLVVTAHIHEARGVYKLGNTTIVNASLMDANYREVNKPWLITYDSEAGAFDVPLSLQE